MSAVKNIVVAVALFVLYWVLFRSFLPRHEGVQAFFGALAATIVSIFLYSRLSKKGS